MKQSSSFRHDSPILICAATSAEANACKKGISGHPSAGRFEILQTGIGATNARQALLKRLQSGPRPKTIVSTGLAGTMADGALIGTWTWGLKVATQDKDELDLQTPPEAVLSAPLKWRSSDFLTVPHIVTNPPIEPTLDMESYVWAELAKDYEIDMHVIRLISDTRDHPLPEAIRAWTLGTRLLAIRHMATDPVPMVKFLIRCNGLLKDLTRGWSLFARDWPKK